MSEHTTVAPPVLPAMGRVVGLPPIGQADPIVLPPLADVRSTGGLRIIAARHASVPIVDLRLLLPLRADTAMDAAVQEVLAGTLLLNTREGGAGPLLNELAAAGATLSAVRSARRMGVAGTGMANTLALLLTSLNEALVRTGHDVATVTAVRKQARAKTALRRSHPQLQVSNALLDHLYGPLPQLQDVPGDEYLARVTAEQVRQAHERWLRPEGATLLIVGDLDPERTVAEAERCLAEWLNMPDDPAPLPQEPELPARTGTGISWVHRPGAAQSLIRLSAPCPGRDDAEFPALSLANLVFGGYFSSRLVADIRERLGLAYRCEAFFRDHLDQMVVCVEADTATAHTTTTLRRIQELMEQLTQHPPSSAEIAAARRYVTGMTTLAVSSQQGWATSLALAVTTGRQPERIPRILDEFAAVTDREVAAAARHHLPGNFAGVVLGDSAHHHEKGRLQ
ncbi:insulinase family protein [Streptomyces varsoviensis]|uniref:M16 family metallopeptidase n=1 Tax=Streptomyces varsoviensis TaxID=67373 RepID=UPI0033FBC374